jgi:hypothetical protein
LPEARYEVLTGRKPVIDFLRKTGIGFSDTLNFEDGSPNRQTILDGEGTRDTGILENQRRMVTQTWTYQPKNTEERIRKYKIEKHILEIHRNVNYR